MSNVRTHEMPSLMFPAHWTVNARALPQAMMFYHVDMALLERCCGSTIPDYVKRTTKRCGGSINIDRLVLSY